MVKAAYRMVKVNGADQLQQLVGKAYWPVVVRGTIKDGSGKELPKLHVHMSNSKPPTGCVFATVEDLRKHEPGAVIEGAPVKEAPKAAGPKAAG